MMCCCRLFPLPHTDDALAVVPTCLPVAAPSPRFCPGMRSRVAASRPGRSLHLDTQNPPRLRLLVFLRSCSCPRRGQKSETQSGMREGSVTTELRADLGSRTGLFNLSSFLLWLLSAAACDMGCVVTQECLHKQTLGSCSRVPPLELGYSCCCCCSKVPHPLLQTQGIHGSGEGRMRPLFPNARFDIFSRLVSRSFSLVAPPPASVDHLRVLMFQLMKSTLVFLLVAPGAKSTYGC